MKRILYVEDSLTSQLIVQRMLGGQCELEIAATPASALALLKDRTYDLVIADYLFPGCTGIDVIIPLRQKWSPMELPIIAVSSAMDSELATRLMNAGVNACVAKPLGIQQFRSLVERMLIAPAIEGTPPAVYTITCFQWYERGAFYEYCPELKILLSGPDGNELTLRMQSVLNDHAEKGAQLGFTAREAVRTYRVEREARPDQVAFAG